MDKEQRWKLLQRYIANCAIGPTTLRNQGPEGISDAARTFLARLRLRALMKKRDTEYSDWLNKKTEELRKKFPRGAQENWGAARKAINLFMVGAYFNKVVSYQYNLHRFKDVLETPLDGVAAERIRQYGRKKGMEWACKLCSEHARKSCKKRKIRCGKSAFPGIKNLKSDQSSGYQDVATKLATELDLNRADTNCIKLLRFMCLGQMCGSLIPMLFIGMGMACCVMQSATFNYN